MSMPHHDFPNTEEIKLLASLNLPSHYRLTDVFCRPIDSLPNDFEIVIKYESRLPESLDYTTHKGWANPLMQDIRSQWPAESLRISFSGTEIPEETDATNRAVSAD